MNHLHCSPLGGGSSVFDPPKQSPRQGLWGSSREGGEASGWRSAEQLPAVSVSLDPRAALRVTVQRVPCGHPPVGGVRALSLTPWVEGLSCEY